MTKENSSQKNLNKARLWFSIVYFVAALILIIIFRNDMFYFEAKKGSWNFARFVWCCSAVFIGFSAIAFALRYHPRTPFPEYLTHYPIQLLAMAALVFGGLHLFDATSGYLFYYLSFGFCFTLGYLADNYWSFVKTVIERAKKQ